MLRHKGQDVAVFSRLRAASHAFLGPDESPGVASLCEHLGIRRRFVSNCTGPGLLDLLDRMLDRHAIPLCRWSIFSEEMRTLAARQGIRTMLSGFAGDNCFSAPEYSLPATEPWLHNWQWRWQHQRALAQRNQNGRAVKPFARAVLATLAPRLNQRRTTPLKITPLRATPLRITPGLESDSAGPLHNRQLHFRIASGALLAAPHKQAWTYPLLDRRLIEFALACPPQIRTAQGFSRRLARLVIDDRVPASVAWNPRKGRETIPGSREQVVDNGDAIRARLEGWRGHPLVSSVFDLEQAAADARRPSTETAQHWVAEAGRVVDILHIGEFLTRHVEAGMQAFQTLRAG
jgi:asparagine synthetase B (glutamine-hydrolysing)